MQASPEVRRRKKLSSGNRWRWRLGLGDAHERAHGMSRVVRGTAASAERIGWDIIARWVAALHKVFLDARCPG